MLYGIAIWYSSVHFPKPHLLQRTPRHPAAAVMITLGQSRCPLVSGSQSLHHLSLSCKLSEKEKMFHYLVSEFQASPLVPRLPLNHRIPRTGSSDVIRSFSALPDSAWVLLNATHTDLSHTMAQHLFGISTSRTSFPNSVVSLNHAGSPAQCIDRKSLG